MKVCKECNGYIAEFNEPVSTSLSPCSCKQLFYQGMKEKDKIFKEWDGNKMVVNLSDGDIYIKGDTMYRVHLEPIQKMEYASLVDDESESKRLK
jgi:hypothetical protein